MPNHVIPLPQHPQLEIIRTSLSESYADEVVEYRVYNFKVWKNGTVVRGDQSVLGDLVWLVGLAMLYWWLELDIASVLFWTDWAIKVSFIFFLVTMSVLTCRGLWQSGLPCSWSLHTPRHRQCCIVRPTFRIPLPVMLVSDFLRVDHSHTEPGRPARNHKGPITTTTLL